MADEVFAGGGETGALMRALDWAKTPLGPVEQWPQSLRTSVGICLNSRFPVLVWWGPELTMLYNDAYASIIGKKHPRALGRPGREVWPEIWEIIGSMLSGVMERGEATYSEDLMLPLERKGYREECYFTFSYSPIRDESGGVGGVFTPVFETTEKVLEQAAVEAERTRTRQNEALLELEKSVLKLATTGSPLSAALEELMRGIEARFAHRNLLASMLLLEEDGLHLRHGAGNSLPEDYNRAIDGIAIGEAVGSCGTAAFLGKRVIVSDIAHDPLWKDFAELALGHGLEACWSTPIFATSGKVLGTFAIYYRQPGPPSSEEMQAVDLLGRTAAIVIERKGVEERLERNETQLRLITDALPDLVSYIGEDGRYVRVNRAYEELFGRPASEFEGRLVKEVRGPGYAKSGPHLEAALRGEAQRFESQIRAASGEARTLTVQHIPDLDEAGRVRGVVVQGHDISERKRAEEALRSSEDRFRTLFELSPVGVAMTDSASGRFVFANAEMERITGYQLYELRAMTSDDITHPEDRAANQELYQSASSGKIESSVVEKRYLRKDGSAIWARVSLRTLPNPGGKSKYILGAVEDVTERRRAEEALRESEERTRLALSAAQSVGTWDWDVPNDRVYSDANFARIYGVDPERAAAGAPIAEFTRNVPAEDKQRLEAAIESAFRKGGEIAAEYRLVQADGSVRWVYAPGHCTLAAEGSPLRLRGMTLDITERKQREEALRESSERFRFVMEAMPQKIFTATPAGDVDYFNSHWMEYTGLSFEQIKDWGWLQFIHPDDVEENIRRWKRAIDTGEPFQLEHRFRRADGEYRWHLSRARALRDAQGKITMWVGSNTDVHDRRQADEVLRQTEKLAVVGRMAATIAHEINNPLEAVTNLLYLIENEEGADLRGYAQQAQEELRRVSHVVTHTLRFQRQSTSATEESLSALMDSAIGIYQGRLKDSGVRLVRDYNDPQRVRCFASELRQVFANLVGNAFDATRAGGEIMLRVRGGREWKSGAKGVRVSIADTGMGMDAATMKRIFEPFFTTKGINGTGLGLWVSAEILEKHKAALRVKSSVGRGTVFAMWFPIHHGDTENTEKSR